MAEAAPIAIPTGDAYFDPGGLGTVELPFFRAIFDPTTGTDPGNQQINEITAYIDGSAVYGADEDRANWLRTFEGGKLKVSPRAEGDLLPYNDGTQPNAGSPSPDFFVAGDIRCNELPTGLDLSQR